MAPWLYMLHICYRPYEGQPGVVPPIQSDPIQKFSTYFCNTSLRFRCLLTVSFISKIATQIRALCATFFSCYVNFTFSHFSALILPLIMLRNDYQFCCFWLCCFFYFSVRLCLIFKFCWSRWPRGLRRRSVAACFLGLRVRIPRGHGCLSPVNVVCCQVEVYVSGRSIIQRIPIECGVSECDSEASSILRRPWPTSGCCFMKKKSLNVPINNYILNTLNLGNSSSHSFRYF